MRLARWLSCASLLIVAAASAQPAATPDLEGLWVAHAQYGPEVHGRLMILRRGDGLVADIAGFSVPVKQQGNKLSFELPDDKGSFRGEHIGGQIDGQWIQPKTVASGARYATSLILRADGDGRWTGMVVPCEDQMTYYLPITRDAEGRYSTYLRNPERNQGVFYGVSRIEQVEETVRLVGTRRGQKEESIIAAGRRDLEDGTFTFPVRQHLRLRSRYGQQQPFLSARQSAGALPLLAAGAARRRMAGVDARKRGYRSGDDREVRSEADRHADGECQHFASSQLADRAARQARARGVFPWVRTRHAA